jgi:hypothetical protein
MPRLYETKTGRPVGSASAAMTPAQCAVALAKRRRILVQTYGLVPVTATPERVTLAMHAGAPASLTLEVR